MKSSHILLSLLGGAVMIGALHHDNVYRDEYASREDCQRDWGNDATKCQPASTSTSSGGFGSSGGGRFYGPSYESDARPATAHPELRHQTELVKRGGFGRSGAHFSRGG